MSLSRRDLFAILLHWLPLAVAITCLAALLYGVVQQDLRLSANDPQIELAHDAAAALTGGASAQALVPTVTVDLARSLAPYVIVFDDAGQAVASSAQLNQQVPALPSGVLDYVRQHGEEHVTWAPGTGVRSAAVVVRYTGAQSGFVLAGRSLREVERREASLRTFVGLGWVVTLAATFIVVAALALTRASTPSLA